VNNNIPDTRCDESLLNVNVLSLIDDVFGRDNFFRQEQNRENHGMNALGLIDDVFGRDNFFRQEQNRENPGIIVYGDIHGDFKVQNPQRGDIHEEIQVVNHQPIIVNPPENPKPINVKSAWANGSFYLFVFVVVVAGIGFLGKQLDFIVLCVVVIAGVLFIPLIGALQLKQDDLLKDESFLALMKMVIGSLPLIGNPLRGILNPQKEDKN
jgi:hypothetical protein